MRDIAKIMFLYVAAMGAIGVISSCGTKEKQDQVVERQNRHDRNRAIIQKEFDRGYIVCRKGSAYVGNFTDRSFWITPYMIDGIQQKCTNDNKWIEDVERDETL